MATYLVSNNNQIDVVYVNQQINVPGIVKSFIPDIVIVSGGLITAFLDLKTNLGYMRDKLIELTEKDYHLINSVRGQNCTLYDGLSKEKMSFIISRSANYDIVIISGENISKKLLQDQLEGAKPYKNDVSIHILSQGKYPGSYGLNPAELFSKIEINKLAFNSILERIK